jgi:hypothetical protein
MRLNHPPSCVRYPQNDSHLLSRQDVAGNVMLDVGSMDGADEPRVNTTVMR